MFQRQLKLSKNNNLFLFGARSTGKSTLVRSLFSDEREVLWIDLLTEKDEEVYSRHPDELSRVLQAKPYRWVVIDEIQKIPKLLEVVHLEIEKKKTKFILTGSSARKLKRGASDLLGGRAFTYHLFPLTQDELGETFDLQAALSFGTLPGIFEFPQPEDRNEFLRSYAKTYLKEEIIVEQIVRQVQPFKDFLEIAAQCNGEIINYSKIARDIGIDDKTVHSYFQILEDTLIGFFLPPYHRSVRKRQREAPKFYLFDTGVKRALDRSLRVELLPQTSAYSKAFEHWVILEAFRLNEYKRLDFQMMYLRTKDDAEVDLVIERPGEKSLLVEIKSSTHVKEEDASHLRRFLKDWGEPVEAYIWSRDPLEKKFGDVTALPWEKGLRAAGL